MLRCERSQHYFKCIHVERTRTHTIAWTGLMHLWLVIPKIVPGTLLQPGTTYRSPMVCPRYDTCWCSLQVLTTRAVKTHCTHMLALSSQQSTSQIETRFWAVNDLLIARDEVHHSVCCLLVVCHLARLSRLCRGRPRPCSRRLSATGAVFVISFCQYRGS